ncbi:Protein of unknown function DUF3472, partial [Trinorchestia longiramus]
MYRFEKKPDAPQTSPPCEGRYVEDASRGTVNGKPVYVNEQKSIFLAAHPTSGWCVTHTQYWDEVKHKQGSFGGFHFGGVATPVDGSWNDYTVVEEQGFIFISKPGGDNYADCDGFYILDDSLGEVNEKSVFVNHAKNKFLAALPRSGWCITSLGYFKDIKLKQGSFGGYHSVDSSDPDDGKWTSYNVKKFGFPKDPLETCYDKCKWEKLENTCVPFKAVANSGVVRTEDEFLAMRKRCTAMDCGGFAWRKPHYNQFGEEDNPPVCFFYRKSQKELRQSLQCSSEFDFYLAPEEYSPNCCFKPFRDPAPSCHIRWIVDKPVHSFACQIVVPESTSCTYYCVAGFHCGYSGIQQHDGQKQQILFSVWDHPIAPGRVSNCCVYPGMVAKPFEGEGKGMQAIGICGDSCGAHDCSLAAWKKGEPYTFVVRAYSVANGTEFACYFHKPGSGWQLLARHARPDTCDTYRGKLEGLHSFIEDFTGNTLRRSAKFAAWVQYERNGPWDAVRRIKGTSTAENDVPNKTVRLVSEGPFQEVQMISGGESLDDYRLYNGILNNPLPVPDILTSL